MLDIHEFILDGIDKLNAGRYRNVRVRISGSQYVPPNNLKVPDLMDQYFEFYEDKKGKLHSVFLSAEMHQRLVNIHPFIDGNGRTARLIMNLILLKNGFPIVNISGAIEDRKAYYNTLEQANFDQNKTDFKSFILQHEKQSMFDYLNMLAENEGDEAKNKGYYFFRKINDTLD